MYSNESGSRFNIIDLIVKFIFFVIFIFIMIWLFPKVPNMKPFYSNVFRENIKYMQEAGESYFTDERMPKEVGNTEKITLAELYKEKLILPFVDEDGNSCNQYESYVSVTKEENQYVLKTNLVCNKEKDYVVKILGCYTYCEDNKCEKVCEKEKITMYQFKKPVVSTITTYSCEKGYTRDGKYCYKTTLVDTKSAIVEKVVNTVLTMPAKIDNIPASSTALKVNRIKKEDTIKKIMDDVVVKTGDATTTKSCQTVTTQEPYNCNCTTKTVDFKKVYICNTCYRDVKVEQCTDITKPGTTVYSCPSVSTHSSGSGSSLKCWHYQTINNGYTESCPSGTTDSKVVNGKLECYATTPASARQYCSDETYSLIGGICSKTVTGTSYEKKCDDKDYVIEGDKCNLYKTDKKAANATKTKKTTYKYTWSEKETLSGWTRTNKTKIEEGKEICK